MSVCFVFANIFYSFVRNMRYFIGVIGAALKYLYYFFTNLIFTNMKRILLFLMVLGLSSLWTFSSAQTSTIYLTTSGGSYSTEKWVSITDASGGGGTVIWAQGDGTYGNGAGLVSNVAITINDGTTYYINAYDKYADGWDGTIYELKDASGVIIANNGGISPTDGTDNDATSAWGDTQAQELEVSEAFSYTSPSCPAPTTLTATNITATSADLGWTTGGAAAWEIVVQPDGTGAPTGAGTATTTNPYNTMGLTANTAYEFYVRDNCGSEFSTWAGPFAFTTLVSCPAPTALTATGVTATSADLGWTTGGAAAWEIVVQPDGTGAPTGAGTATTTNPYNAMGLTANTAYEFYVRDNCGGGDYSSWAGPFAFTTLPVNDNLAGAIPITPSPMGTGCSTFTFTAKLANDGTTDSGLDGTCNNANTGLDRFYSWTATTDALVWNDGAGNPGIVIRDAFGNEITCEGTYASADAQLSGWSINDDLIIQVYDYGAYNVELTFCLELDMLPTAPECASLVAPTDASSLSPDDGCTNEMILEWTPSSSGSTPATYEVYFGTPGNLTLHETVNAPTTTSIVSVTLGTTHAWQIIPKDAGGNAPAATCPEWTFTVSDANSGSDGSGAGNGGYDFANDLASGPAPTYDWIDPVAAGHTEITSWTSGTADDGYFLVPDIGFAFPFYGVDHQTDVYIGSNGYMTFGAGVTSTQSGTTIPSTSGPEDWIAVMAMDLDAGANGKVYYGMANGNFVITWWHYVDYNQPDYITCQVILFNDTYGSIKMQYNDAESTIPMAAAFFNDGLIGIENAAGDDGIAYRDGTGGGGVLFCSPRAVSFSTSASVLPIALGKFQGKLMTRSNMLTWTTETERNGSYFEVQRAASGSLDFESIGRVEASGNTNTLMSYSFEDEKPSSLAYYRLKMVDLDGSYEYSDVISLLRKEKGFGLYGAYPVPTSAVLTVEFTTEAASDMTVALTDVTGRVLLTEKFESTSGIQKHDVDMSSLALGTYFVKLSDGQQTLIQRVVKQ